MPVILTLGLPNLLYSKLYVIQTDRRLIIHHKGLCNLHLMPGHANAGGTELTSKLCMLHLQSGTYR